MLYLDMFPIQAEFFRQDHGKSGHDALAHFRLAENERHAIVGRDAHPGVEGVRGLLFLLFGLIGKSARRKMEADDQRHTPGDARLEKITAIYNWSYCHGTPRDVLRQPWLLKIA